MGERWRERAIGGVDASFLIRVGEGGCRGVRELGLSVVMRLLGEGSEEVERVAILIGDGG